MKTMSDIKQDKSQELIFLEVKSINEQEREIEINSLIIKNWFESITIDQVFNNQLPNEIIQIILNKLTPV